jgi:hypothetical protein
MIAPITGIATIEQAISDEKLLRRALLDASEALKMYAIAGHRSTHGAIRFLETLRQQLDEARQHVQAVRAEARP